MGVALTQGKGVPVAYSDALPPLVTEALGDALVEADANAEPLTDGLPLHEGEPLDDPVCECVSLAEAVGVALV